MNDLQIQALDVLLDDHFALWDFGDQFPAFQPVVSNSKLEELIQLVASGFVMVTHGRWFENDTTPVVLEEAVTALHDPSAWLPSGREPGYVIELTEQGRNCLRSLGIWSGSTG